MLGNRAIQLTAPGTAALAVVRVEGERAQQFVAEHFDHRTPEGRCVYGRWHEAGGAVLDDPLVVFDGHGYDINLHGGRRVVGRLLEQAAAAGFEVVMGQAALDMLEDELEGWLPHARTEAGLGMLLSQREAWRSVDPETLNPSALLNDLTLRRLLVPATVALVGAANVGKSTLANHLFGQQRSIVADRPGTTRDWVGHLADLQGLPVTLVDTPGRRASDDAIEQAAIGLSDHPLRSADVVVLVIDATRPEDVPAGFDRAIRVANKSDLAEAPADCQPICATNGTGVERVIAAIHERLGVDLNDLKRPNLWTMRQVAWVEDRGREGVATVRDALMVPL